MATKRRGGTRAKSTERLSKLNEGYPLRDPKTKKVTVSKSKKNFSDSGAVRDRKVQTKKVAKEV